MNDNIAAAARDFAAALVEPTQAAAEAMRQFGILASVGSCWGSTAVDRVAPLSELAARGLTNAQPTACARCLYFNTSPHLHCAVHPQGRPGEVCSDWEDGGTDAAKQWRLEAQARSLEAECSVAEVLTADLVIRMDEVESARYIAQQRESEEAWVRSHGLGPGAS